MKDVSKTDFMRLAGRLSACVEDIEQKGTGDVCGPGSTTDGNIAVFSGTDGKTIKDSGIAGNTVYRDGEDIVMTKQDPHIRFNPSGANDFAGIRFNYNNNDGSLELWTSDDWSEPIKFRMYESGSDGTGAYEDKMLIYRDYIYFKKPISLCGTQIREIDNDGAIRIQGGEGYYVDIGPKNGVYCHFDTDRSAFYFKKTIYADGNILPYGGTEYFGCTSKPWVNVYADLPTTSSNNTLRRDNSTNQLLYYSSSLRFKENVRALEDEGIDPDVIYNIQPRVFDEKSDERRGRDTGNIIGFIAEEIEAACPDIVYYDRDGNVQSYSEDAMVALLVGAVGQLKARVDTLEKMLGVTPKSVPESGKRMKSGTGLSVKADRAQKISGV